MTKSGSICPNKVLVSLSLTCFANTVCKMRKYYVDYITILGWEFVFPMHANTMWWLLSLRIPISSRICRRLMCDRICMQCNAMQCNHLTDGLHDWYNLEGGQKTKKDAAAVKDRLQSSRNPKDTSTCMMAKSLTATADIGTLHFRFPEVHPSM